MNEELHQVKLQAAISKNTPQPTPISPLKSIKYWKRIPRELTEPPSLDIFKLPWEEGKYIWRLEVPRLVQA